ncbi:MAG TPA: hypothetical protein VKR32_11170 [Puia sp.]|nr:hypothetical protein [Puia sp.]
MTKALASARRWLLFFVVMLLLSGLTAIPVEMELELIQKFVPRENDFGSWVNKVLYGIITTEGNYPWLFYGYDWLAFAHIILAILFAGAIKDPAKNRWIIDFGIITCLMVVPFALIAGNYRGIPWGWRWIDCSFGLFGIIPLLIIKKRICALERGIFADEGSETELKFVS